MKTIERWANKPMFLDDLRTALKEGIELRWTPIIAGAQEHTVPSCGLCRWSRRACLKGTLEDSLDDCDFCPLMEHVGHSCNAPSSNWTTFCTASDFLRIDSTETEYITARTRAAEAIRTSLSEILVLLNEQYPERSTENSEEEKT